MSAEEKKTSHGGCNCGCGGAKKKSREGQPVDEEGRINLGLTSMPK